jgi:hypothetical protein
MAFPFHNCRLCRALADRIIERTMTVKPPWTKPVIAGPLEALRFMAEANQKLHDMRTEKKAYDDLVKDHDTVSLLMARAWQRLTFEQKIEADRLLFRIKTLILEATS